MRTNLVRTIPFLSILASATLLGGCGSSPASSPESVAAPTPSIDAAPLCAKGEPADTATAGRKVMRSRGTGWTYQLDLPTDYDGATPVPLVLAFGSGAAPTLPGLDADASAVTIQVSGPIDGGPWTGDAAEIRMVKDLVLRAQTQLCFDEGAVFIVDAGGAEAVTTAAARELPEIVKLGA